MNTPIVTLSDFLKAARRVAARQCLVKLLGGAQAHQYITNFIIALCACFFFFFLFSSALSSSEAAWGRSGSPIHHCRSPSTSSLRAHSPSYHHCHFLYHLRSLPSHQHLYCHLAKLLVIVCHRGKNLHLEEISRCCIHHERLTLIQKRVDLCQCALQRI